MIEPQKNILLVMGVTMASPDSKKENETPSLSGKSSSGAKNSQQTLIYCKLGA